MKKIALLAPGDLQLQTVEEGPALQSGTVKVHVSACGICGSDLALLNGTRDMTKELYFGHEFSGVVTETADDSCGFQPGMRVATELARTCGQCWNCRNGLPNYCRSMNDALLPGGFTEETLVHSTPDYGFLSQIPDTLDDITASLLEPANCAYHIAMQANIKPGDNVVVFGLGAMGIIAAIMLKQLGAGAIVCVGRRPARQEKARQTGIFDAVVGNDEDGMAQIRQICGEKGADVTIEATGSPQVLTDAIRVVRSGGRVVVGSVYHGTIRDFDPLPIFRKELTLAGAKGPTVYRRTDGSSAVMYMMERAQNDLKKIISVYDYKDALKAFEDAKSGEAIKAVITF
ncbi:MAG: alcohol dehydrogenase catalytic domain-containing protein [Oscillospiraceae bacterium]|nr:alcohol dehydrogenase catalytic domain-containing protein [Oscillospiraceae bacterium]